MIPKKLFIKQIVNCNTEFNQWKSGWINGFVIEVNKDYILVDDASEEIGKINLNHLKINNNIQIGNYISLEVLYKKKNKKKQTKIFAKSLAIINEINTIPIFALEVIHSMQKT